MKKFIIFYKGLATPPGASHEGWPEWFDKIGDKLVDRGSPMNNGFTVRSDGSTNDSATNLNGFSLIQAQDKDEALSLIKDHPYLAIGKGEYTIEVFEAPSA